MILDIFHLNSFKIDTIILHTLAKNSKINVTLSDTGLDED